MLVTQVRSSSEPFSSPSSRALLSSTSISTSQGFFFSSSLFPSFYFDQNPTQIFLHDPDHNMVEICNCGLIPVVPVQEGRSALLSKRSSIDMGQHARASVAAKLVPGAASVPAPPASHATAQVAVCGLAGCFPARPTPLSVPEGIPCCGSGAFASTAPAATAVAADCTSSGAASAAAASAALPSFTPHGFLHRSDDGTVAGSSPHLPGVRSRPSLAGAGNGNDFAGCFDIARPPLSDSSFLSPRGDKSRTWLQQQQQEQRQQNGGEDEMMGVRTAQAQAEAGISSPQPPMVSVAAGGGGERSRGGGRG